MKRKKLKLMDLAEVSTGIVLNRVEEELGKSYRVFQYSNEECSSYEIKSDKEIGANYILEKNDIVFKTIYPCRAILVSEENIGNILSSNYGRIRITSKLITSEFLECFLNSKLAEKAFIKLVAGSTIKKINMQGLKETLVPILELEKQKKIFELNSKLVEKISELEKLVELTKEMQDFYISEFLK